MSPTTLDAFLLHKIGASCGENGANLATAALTDDPRRHVLVRVGEEGAAARALPGDLDVGHGAGRLEEGRN